VYVADAAGRDVAIRETDKLTGRFATGAEVAAVSADLETWSRLVFESIEREASSGDPSYDDGEGNR
jgi:predicted NUDIX family phosphoesterase